MAIVLVWSFYIYITIFNVWVWDSSNTLKVWVWALSNGFKLCLYISKNFNIILVRGDAHYRIPFENAKANLSHWLFDAFSNISSYFLHLRVRHAIYLHLIKWLYIFVSYTRFEAIERENNRVTTLLCLIQGFKHK